MLNGEIVMKARLDTKSTVDASWDRALEAAINGNIDRERIWRAMDACNRADQAILDEEKRRSRSYNREIPQ